MPPRKKGPRRKKAAPRKPVRGKTTRKRGRKKKLGIVKAFDSWKKARKKSLKKNRFKLIAFAILFIFGGMFLFFQDYRSDGAQFESVVKAVAKNTKNATIASRRSIPKENWRAKWNEVSLVVRVGRNTTAASVLTKIKAKLPKKYKLYREVIAETGVAYSVSAEFRRNNIPIGRVRIESKKKSTSTEFLAKEKEVVKPKKFFFLPKITKKPPAKKKVVKKPTPKPVARKTVPSKTAPTPKAGGARVVIVIDDVGNSNKLYPELFSLPKKVTIAVLPRLRYSKEAVTLGKQKGYEMILHQPVEALHHNDTLGPGGVFVGQSAGEVEVIVGNNLDSLRGITGSNNHMGSRGTQDRKLMGAYMKALKKRNMFYLDSWTTKNSVGREMANKNRVPNLRRAVFLDNVDTTEAIRKQMRELIAAAKENGVAIGIGHIRKNTITVLQEMIPQMERNGIRIVRLKDLL